MQWTHAPLLSFAEVVESVVGGVELYNTAVEVNVPAVD